MKGLQQVVVVLLRGADDWSAGEPSVSGNSGLFEELPAQQVPEAPGGGMPRFAALVEQGLVALDG
jgi:hypothetical protein